MKLYVYNNKLNNCCGGHFCFIAKNKIQLHRVINQFLEKHNKGLKDGRYSNYGIELQLETISSLGTSRYLSELR